MDSITLIIVLLVAAMVIGPVAMLRPSAGQKKREQQRQYVVAKGLGVTLRALPKLATDMEEAGLLPTYTLQIKGGETWTLRRASFAHESHLAEYWQFVGSGRPSAAVEVFLKVQLPLLSPRIQAISSAAGELAFTWYASSQNSDVDVIADFLRQLAAAQGAVVIPREPLHSR